MCGDGWIFEYWYHETNKVGRFFSLLASILRFGIRPVVTRGLTGSLTVTASKWSNAVTTTAGCLSAYSAPVLHAPA